MVRDRSRQQHPKKAPGGHINWFASADSGLESIEDWDSKAQTFAEAVLGVLAAGNAIMFGVSQQGDAVSVTIYVGDSKQRKWVTDSIELDDLMGVIWKQGRPKGGMRIVEAQEPAAD